MPTWFLIAFALLNLFSLVWFLLIRRDVKQFLVSQNYVLDVNSMKQARPSRKKIALLLFFHGLMITLLIVLSYFYLIVS
jgi:hypothetical protein